MKKKIMALTITVFFIAVLNSASAQYLFPFDELQKFCSISSNEFEKQVLSKKYTLQDYSSNSNIKTYVSTEKAQPGYENSISRSIKNNRVTIEFRTISKSYYDNIKNYELAKDTGWKFLGEDKKTINSIPVIFYGYKNNAFTVLLFAISYPGTSGNGITLYNVDCKSN
jgi:hypothetical protein